MRTIKTLGLAFLAVFAFGAIMAVSAQAKAPRWTVGPTDPGGLHTLAAGEERSLTGTTTGTPSLTAGTLTLTSSLCHTEGKIIGSVAGSPGTFTGDVLCTDVTVKEAAACKVSSPGKAVGEVTTTNLTGTLVWLAQTPSDKAGMLFREDKLPAATEGHFVTIKIAECALAGEYPVKNEQICEVAPVQEDVVNGTLNCPTAIITKYFTNQTPLRTEDTITRLKMGGVNATFVAHSENLHLTNNVTWGVETG